MQQTNTYKLNLIETNDTFSTAPLNENMEKVEAELSALNAAAVKIATGTYIGTGVFGNEAPSSLSFEFEPRFLLIWTKADTYTAAGTRGENLVCYYTEKWGELTTTWSGNTVSWYSYVYSGDGSRPQMNGNNMKYQYLALG